MAKIWTPGFVWLSNFECSKAYTQNSGTVHYNTLKDAKTNRIGRKLLFKAVTDRISKECNPGCYISTCNQDHVRLIHT